MSKCKADFYALWCDSCNVHPSNCPLNAPSRKLTMTPRNVYIAIMKAHHLGKGLHLTAYEVSELAFDDAVETHALNCLEDSDWPEHKEGNDFRLWDKIDPRKPRKGANLTNLAPEDRR